MLAKDVDSEKKMNFLMLRNFSIMRDNLYISKDADYYKPSVYTYKAIEKKMYQLGTGRQHTAMNILLNYEDRRKNIVDKTNESLPIYKDPVYTQIFSPVEKKNYQLGTGKCAAIAVNCYRDKNTIFSSMDASNKSPSVHKDPLKQRVDDQIERQRKDNVKVLMMDLFSTMW